MKRVRQERLRQEFDLQVQNLIHKGYAKIAPMGTREFLANLEALRDRVGELPAVEPDLDAGRIPFVIVIKSDWVATKKAMSLVEREGKKGFTQLYPRQPSDFSPIDGLAIPSGSAYLLADVDRGSEYINIAPREALNMITQKGRSPLTIDEGIAIVTHYPEFLKKNHCFSLLASRHSADQRVPAIWINKDKRVRLGWCWNGNPHSWLGSAWCGCRIGP